MDSSQELASQPTVVPQTPSRKTSTNTHRLLYRGSLTLPDSHIPLDGLSLTTNVAEARTGNSPSTSLLENPLALALESMRGRPLHFKGTEKLQDVWLESTVDINVSVHRYSVITQIYFENVFCLSPVVSSDRRTPCGVRVGLSDTNEADDFMIYGELRPQPQDATEPLPSSSSKPPETLCILAARILQHPPARLPRPDDPTPRKPSAYALGASAKRKRDPSSTNLDLGEAAKRARPSAVKGKGRAGDEADEQIRLAREVMLHIPKPGSSLPRLLGRDARPGKSTDVFKVPALPPGRGTDADVFGTVESSSKKDKDRPGSDELEKANKTVIKQAAMTCLTKHGIKKNHSEFSEIFSATYRGAAFALRNVIRIQAVNTKVVDKLLETHARIYVNGTGENHAGEK